MMRLEEYIERNAQLYPEQIAVTSGQDSITYSDLWKQVTWRANELSLRSERAVVVRASQSIDFLVAYFASHVARKVIVPLEYDIPDARLHAIVQTVSSSDIPHDVSDILYTTGTTGKQKGTMISHKAIVANAENLIDAQGFSHDVRFIISGPLNHIGSLSKIWPTIMVGGSIAVLDGMKNLNEFFAAIATSTTRVATFLVPASIRMLLQFCRNQLKECASKIDFIETGAAPIAQSDMEALCAILPNARLYNTYASTETGIICTHNYNSECCVAGCLGRTMKHAHLEIAADGLICCHGDTIMSGYVGDEETTRSVLRDGVIYTQDRGELDSEGRLHLKGRDGDVINIGGYKINPVEIEDIAMSFPKIADCVCIESPHPVLGSALKLLFVAEDGVKIDVKALGKMLLANLERYKVPQLYSQVPSIKRTYNGKLDRKYYR